MLGRRISTDGTDTTLICVADRKLQGALIECMHGLRKAFCEA